MSSILRGILDRRSQIDDAIDAGTYGQNGYGYWSGGMDWVPGPNVSASSPTRAMQVAALYACWRLLTDAISTLPIDTFRTTPAGRVEIGAPKFLTFGPAQRLSSRIDYLTQVVLSLLSDGNALIATPRDPLGVPVDLVPLDPKKVTIGAEKGRPIYEVGGRKLTGDDILHIPALMLPGETRGVAPLTAARMVLDGAASAQDFGVGHFNNSSVPPAVIKIPPTQGAKQGADGDSKIRARRIAQAWDESHRGAANAGSVGVLVDGAELQTIAVSAKDAQWLEARQFSVQEIARIYGVPPHLIADSSNSTSWGSGLAEQNLAFGQFSLRPIITRIEEAHNRLLPRPQFVKLNLDALLRASLKDRYEAYRIGLDPAAPFLDVDEVRGWEDLPPMPERPEPAEQPAPPTEPPGGGE